jgi:hypothetical protein
MPYPYRQLTGSVDTRRVGTDEDGPGPVERRRRDGRDPSVDEAGQD